MCFPLQLIDEPFAGLMSRMSHVAFRFIMKASFINISTGTVGECEGRMARLPIWFSLGGELADSSQVTLGKHENLL